MPVDQWLRKRFWLVPLPLTAIAAFLNAQAVTQLVGVGMSVDAAQLALPPWRAPSPHAARLARALSATPILERNPFDHVTGSLVPASSSPSEATSETAEIGDPMNAAVCDDVVVEVIVASDDVDWSFASLSTADKRGRLLRRGGEISGKKVHFIGWDRVWLSSEGGLCQAKLFDAKKTAPTAPPPAPTSSAPPPRSKGAQLNTELRKGIQAVSATEFNVDRGVVDKILENQAELMRQARIAPVQENGRTVGVRLTGIRPDALLGVLGMQNGDRLDTINGFEVANPEKALEAYARLRTADKLTLQINRAGKNVNLDYNIK